MRIDNVLLLNAADASTSQTSDPQQIAHGFTFAVIGRTSTNAIGTLKVQVSVDPAHEDKPTLVDSTSFADLATATIGIGSNALGGINFSGVGANWMRVVWTPTGTVTGTITARFNCKGT